MKPLATGNVANFRRCLIDGCRRPHYARGLCEPDYQEWRRDGKPDDFTPKRLRPRRPLPASFRVFTG
jgi:hypothetical protein